MQAMSEYVPVFFLDYATTAGKRLGFRIPRAERVSPNVVVIHDAMWLRFTGLGRRLGSLGSWIDGAMLGSLLRRLGVREYVYWLATPNPTYLNAMRTDRLVYDCMDPCYGEENRARYDAEEELVTRRSQVVVCVAECLREKLSPIHPRVHMLENACHSLRYHETSFASPEPPPALRNLKRPIVGSIGTLDERFDMSLAVAAAKRSPDYTFVFVGRVSPDQEQASRELRALPNVVLPGESDGDLGRAYIASFDAAIIPFRPIPVYDGCNPVKMWMFMAEGKPLITSWTRECWKYAPYVHATHDAAEFAEAIRQEIEADSPDAAAARIAFAMQNTWDHRARAAIDILLEYKLLEPLGERKGS